MPSHNATKEEKARYHREWRARNKEHNRAYKHKYNKEWRSKYGYHNENKAKDSFRKKFPRKVRAQKKVQQAIKRGDLVRQPCEVCGQAENIHAHHKDYDKPLEVNWLCPLHHIRRHLGEC